MLRDCVVWFGVVVLIVVICFWEGLRWVCVFGFILALVGVALGGFGGGIAIC